MKKLLKIKITVSEYEKPDTETDWPATPTGKNVTHSKMFEAEYDRAVIEYSIDAAIHELMQSAWRV